MLLLTRLPLALSRLIAFKASVVAQVLTTLLVITGASLRFKSQTCFVLVKEQGIAIGSFAIHTVVTHTAFVDTEAAIVDFAIFECYVAFRGSRSEVYS